MNDSGQRLRHRLEAVRERTLLLYEPLDDATLRRAPEPIMSPPLWDLGHIAAYEELWLVRRLTGKRSLYPDLQAVYDAFETPRATRTGIRMLEPDAARAYLDEVRLRALDALDAADLGEDGPPLTRAGFVFDMVAQHEAQHTETVLQTLQMLPAGSYRPPVRRRLPDAPAGALPNGPALVPSGSFEMGADGQGFAYDCERPRHQRAHGAFLIDRLPATNGRHLEFMADDGYRRPELWSAEGWAWRQREGVDAPLYWERDGAGWLERRFERTEPVDPALPVSHVSWYEADAHARWAGGRLPSEVEWERAAGWDPALGAPQGVPWGDGAAAGRANLDQLAFGPAPAGAYPEGAAPSGCLGMLGDVWEWTATCFRGYPGFRAFPYREYAEVFFGGGYRVLRGGSWATQPHAASTTFRNWDHPYRRQIFAGFRVARDLDEGADA
ncbi:MAG: gamma-glutamyl hercynylcysteine S-oxide synthase [Miltoncostaeaceae bacterium]|nr:gamma-glutamyl hercynylcysteine S-oxide synthase [Miltoncostaeaceae bacterium]